MTKGQVDSVTFVGALPDISRVRKYDWKKITDELRAHPGEWAVIDDENKHTLAAAQGLAAVIRQGRHVGISKGEFEATTRMNVVYARYKGGK